MEYKCTNGIVVGAAIQEWPMRVTTISFGWNMYVGPTTHSYWYIATVDEAELF